MSVLLESPTTTNALRVQWFAASFVIKEHSGLRKPDAVGLGAVTETKKLHTRRVAT